MNKNVFKLVTSAALSICIGTSVGASELKFQCVDSSGSFAIIVDTKTGSVMAGEPTLLPGRAVISGSTISIAMNDDPSYHAQLDRKTGAFRDSEGVVAICKLGK